MSRYVELGRFKMINDCHFYRACFNKVYIYIYVPRYVNLHLASLITFKVGDAPNTAMSALHIAPNGGNVISVFYGFEHCGIDTSSWLQCT